jgi:hypothetical protein
MNIVFILTTVGLGLLWSVPGIIIGYLLANRGLIPRSLLIIYVGSLVFMTFVLRLTSQPVFWGYYVLLSVLTPLTAYRAGLMFSRQKGKWWWTRPQEKKIKTNRLGNFLAGVLCVLGILVIIIWIFEVFHR